MTWKPAQHSEKKNNFSVWASLHGAKLAESIYNSIYSGYGRKTKESEGKGEGEGGPKLRGKRFKCMAQNRR